MCSTAPGHHVQDAGRAARRTRLGKDAHVRHVQRAVDLEARERLARLVRVVYPQRRGRPLGVVEAGDAQVLERLVLGQIVPQVVAHLRDDERGADGRPRGW